MPAVPCTSMGSGKLWKRGAPSTPNHRTIIESLGLEKTSLRSSSPTFNPTPQCLLNHVLKCLFDKCHFAAPPSKTPVPSAIASAVPQMWGIKPLWKSPFLWQSQRSSTRDVHCPCEFSWTVIDKGMTEPLRLLQLTLCNTTSRQIKKWPSRNFPSLIFRFHTSTPL